MGPSLEGDTRGLRRAFLRKGMLEHVCQCKYLTREGVMLEGVRMLTEEWE